MIYGFQKVNNKLVELESYREASWVCLYPPFDPSELDEVAKEYDIPLDFLTDSLDIEERSRYEKDEETIFILLNTPILNDDDRVGEAIYITSPIGVVLIDKTIITISPKENPILEKFMDNKVKNFDPNDSKMFVIQIFEQTVYRYLDCLKKLNLKRNLIEQELYNSSRNEELKHLLRIEKSLVYFVNSLSSNDLLKMKIKRTDLLKISNLEEHSDLFEDIIIDNSQALEMSNVYTNILSGTMEAYASIVSNNMNLFINRLTIITIILMVPTVVASFYGMNLEYLPFSKNKYAFFIIIGFSIALGYGLITWVRRANKM
jgi:magnesium transporter